MPTSRLVTPSELATQCFAIRERMDATQQEVADRVGLSTSSASKCERYHHGDGMTGTRIRIIEALTDATVEGPFYRIGE